MNLSEKLRLAMLVSEHMMLAYEPYGLLRLNAADQRLTGLRFGAGTLKAVAFFEHSFDPCQLNSSARTCHRSHSCRRLDPVYS